MHQQQQGLTLQAMQQMMMQQQQQQQQQYQYQLQQQFMQTQQHQQAPQPILSPQQQQTTGQLQHQHMPQQQQPLQVQSNMMWPINLQQQQQQVNPYLAPVTSFSSTFSSIDETTKVVAAKMAPALGELRTVNSQGMLLPLVAIPTADSSSDENPKVQMLECMNVIEEALQDPALVDAGKVLLKAMTASSSYMSDILESKKQYKQQQQQVQKLQQVQNQLQLQREQQDHQKQVQSQSGTDRVFFLGSPMHARNASASTLLSDPVKEPCDVFSGAILREPSLNVPAKTAAPVTPVLSATYPQQVHDSTKSATIPRADPPAAHHVKSIVHKASRGRVEKTSAYKHQHHQTSKPNINPELTKFEGSPHKFLLAILHARGYPTLRLTSYEAGYHVDPTHLQLASFGSAVVKAVHSSDARSLSKLIGCGLSPNPCNQFGDSILSLICKRADYSVFSVLVDQGCDLQICDSFGRTALHNLAWASRFSGPMAKVILDYDLHQVLLEDKRGQCPLEYVRQDKWGEWISFLRANMDVYWPVSYDRPIKPLPRDFRNGSVADPMPALSTDLAVKISSGEVSPEDAARQSQPAPPTPVFSLI